MPRERTKVINRFWGGIVRDDKSKVIGAASNIEELDIFANADFFQAEQIVSSYALPATSRGYAWAAGDDDTTYLYGDRTDTTAGTVRLFSVATGGADNPGTLSTLFTSADTTNLATKVSDCKFFRTTESSNPTSLYYIQGASATWYIGRYNIGAAAEQTWNGSAWAAGTANASSQLTGLGGSFDRPTMAVIFGDLYICHGRFIAKVAKDSTFTLKAFTLPSEWEAVDIVAVGTVGLILARNKTRLSNESKGFWWDLTKTTGFEDSFSIPMGGPCWAFNHQETIKILCAINGSMKIFQLPGAYQGGVVIEIPGVGLTSVAAETTTNPISMHKMVSTKDKILYFGLWKTDKTGIYALGKLDADKPNALILSKRFDTSDYSLHKPMSVHIQGPNFYGAFDDNGTFEAAICKTNNSPSRSSSGTYESIDIDFDSPFKDKTLIHLLVAIKALPASSTVTPSVATDYGTSYTAVKRADASVLNTTNAVLGKFIAAAFNNKKAFKVKLVLASSGVNSPKVQEIALVAMEKDEIASV